MIKKHALKLFTVIFLFTTFIYSLSQYGYVAFQKVIASDQAFEENTTVASINISGMTREKVENVLSEKKQTWQKESTIELIYKEKTQKIKTDLIQFSIPNTIQNIKNGAANNVAVTLDEEELLDSMEQISSSFSDRKKLKFNSLSDLIIGYASSLESNNYKVNLEDFVAVKEESTILSESTIKIQDHKDQFEKWTKEFSSIPINSQQQFSLLNMLEEKKSKSYSSKTLSIVSSALYKTLVSSNFKMIERHTSRQLPDFAEPGYEVKIQPNQNMDFVFYNPNKGNYTIEFKYTDNLLYVALKGTPYLYSYKTAVGGKKTYKQKTVIQFDPELSFGQEKVVTKGEKGFLINIYRETLDEDGKRLKKELISSDFYPPINQIVAVSLLEDTESSDIDDTILEEESIVDDETDNSEESITDTSTDSESTETDEEEVEEITPENITVEQ